MSSVGAAVRSTVFLCLACVTGCFDSVGLACPDSEPLCAIDAGYPTADKNGSFDLVGALPDLSSPDLSLPDLSLPDLSLPDLSLPDLSLPDLAYSDRSTPDQVTPDLLLRDLATSDLTLPDLEDRDLAVPDLAQPDMLPAALFGSNTYTSGPANATDLTVGKFAAPSGSWDDIAVLYPFGGTPSIAVYTAGKKNNQTLGRLSVPALSVPNPLSVRTTDVNGDGVADLILGLGACGLDVLYGTKVGTGVDFQSGDLSYYFDTMEPSNGVLAVTPPTSSAAALSIECSSYLATVTGTLHGSTLNPAANVNLPMAGTTGGLAIGNFDYTQSQNLAFADNATSTVDIHLSTGPGMYLQGPAMAHLANSTATRLVRARINDDAFDDLVVVETASGTLEVLVSNTQGTLGALTPMTVAPGPVAVALADLDGDLITDLAVADSVGIEIFLGTGKGGFVYHSVLKLTSATSVAIGDFDGDGAPDIAATTSNGSNTLNVFFHTPPG